VTHVKADLVSTTSTLLQVLDVPQLKVDLDIAGDCWDCFFQENPWWLQTVFITKQYG